VEEKIDIIVDQKDSGTRLDVFLTHHLSLSRSAAARIIESGLVLVDGKMRRPAFKVKAGMRVYGAFERAASEATLLPWEISLKVIFEDEWIIVIDKPAGLVVHPGAGNADCTLIHALFARYPEIKDVGESARPGIVHRLDKLTSGVMVVARNNEAHAALSHAFKVHEQRREYLAICYGHMSQEQGSIETYMQRHPKDRKRMTSRVKNGRKAVTHYQVIRQWKAFSLLSLRLETGRTHQIRVHLSDLGHPVAGDAQYGGRRRAGVIADKILRSYIKNLTRQMLHAAMLGIIHPGTGRWMEFKAEMPEDMKALIAVLDEREVRE
jgi:23S rRNA pseudouridine1911/1915/1917 synthase